MIVYEDLLLEVLKYSSKEAQIVKFFDHIDALCEALHEVFAWNKCIVTMYKDKFWKEGILPFDYYKEKFSKAKSVYNMIDKIFNNEYKDFSPFLCNFERIEFEKLVENYKAHTIDWLQKKFDYNLYDYWKDTMLRSDDRKVIDAMINFSQKRFWE